MKFNGEIEVADFDTFDGYEICGDFRHFKDNEGDFCIYFKNLSDAQNALRNLDKAFSLRDVKDELYSWELKSNEDFVSFQLVYWKNGCGTSMGVSTKEQIIELY